MIQVRLFLLIAIVFFAGPAIAAPQGDPIGKVTLVLGTVSGVDQDGDAFEVKRGMSVFAGYTFETERRSMIRAEMNDGTRLTLSQNSSATLESFSYDPLRGTGGFNASVQRGGFKYRSGELGKFSLARQHSSISTPAGVIGIRGTVIEAVITESGRITLRVTEGNVNFTTPSSGGVPIPVGVDTNDLVIEVEIDGVITPLGDTVSPELQIIIEDIIELVEEGETLIQNETVDEEPVVESEEEETEESEPEASEPEESETLELTYDAGEQGNPEDASSSGGGDLDIIADQDGEPVVTRISSDSPD